MKTTDINQFIFTRTQPVKKIETIERLLTESELLGITEPTLTRIVKEAGKKVYKSRDKRLYISKQVGNHWNSTVCAVELIKGKLYLDIYVQYENTDTNTTEEYKRFISGTAYRGEIRRLDRYGNGRTYYFNYDQQDKARVIRSILVEYVRTKYHDKLTEG